MPDPDIRQLIFVIGFPRSGTTWFSNLLNSHPDTVYRHEVFGRQFSEFGDQLFRRLKFDHGLSDADYAEAVRIVLKANTETDKPPFFPKRFRSMRSAGVQQFAWLASRALPILAPLYGQLYTPRGRRVTLVVKETRSSVNLGSIIAGARADKLVVLIRHPYGVIASHMRGIQAGLMSRSSADYRRVWFKHNEIAAYVTEAALGEREVVGMEEPEFLAVAWRVQNEDYLRIHSTHSASQIVVYDTFLEDTERNADRMLKSLDLELNDQVRDFIRQSREAKERGWISKDASSEFFSVYRGKTPQSSWREVLRPEDLRAIDGRTGPLVQQFGLDRQVKETNLEPMAASGGGS